MIIINNNGLLGDSLSTLPAIWAASQKNPTHLISQNFEVACLLPESENITHIKNIEEIFQIPNLEKEKVYVLGASPNFNMFCSAGLHMSQGHFRFLDLPIPQEIPTVKLNIEPKDVEAYDFIISMYSRSDDRNNKFWPLDRWSEIIDWLKSKNYTVATIGSGRHEEQILPNATHHIHGRSLNEVSNYLIKAKHVLTIDNGPSHLARLLDVKSPFLLYPQCLPQNWVTNPKANVLRGNPLDISVEQVKQFLQKCYSL